VPLSVHELYTSLMKEGIIFCFCGSVSQSIVEGIGETLWQRMELEGTQTTTISKVFPIFVEQMQNILSYSAEKITSEKNGGEELRFGIVTVGKAEGRFYVCCGNYVEKQSAETLMQRLRELRLLDKEQLKELYKKQRKVVTLDGKLKGAGLGLIDMARRASKPLEYDLIPVDEAKMFFTMTTTI
jgi:hypothetical protein